MQFFKGKPEPTLNKEKQLCTKLILGLQQDEKGREGGGRGKTPVHFVAIPLLTYLLTTKLSKYSILSGVFKLHFYMNNKWLTAVEIIKIKLENSKDNFQLFNRISASDIRIMSYKLRYQLSYSAILLGSGFLAGGSREKPQYLACTS